MKNEMGSMGKDRPCEIIARIIKWVGYEFYGDQIFLDNFFVKCCDLVACYM